jgi:hypothetical protein
MHVEYFLLGKNWVLRSFVEIQFTDSQNVSDIQIADTGM